MKKLLVSFLFFSFIFGSVFADETCWIKCKKQYINPSKLKICDKGIFVNIDNNIIRVNNIQHDEKGFSFSEYSETDQTAHWFLECWNCGELNNPLRKYCWNCGERL